MSKRHKIKHVKTPKLNHDFNKINSSNRAESHKQATNKTNTGKGGNHLQQLREQIGTLRAQLSELESEVSQVKQDNSGFIDSSNKAKDTAEQYRSRAEVEDTASQNEEMIAGNLQSEGSGLIREGYSSIFTGQSMTDDDKVSFLGSNYIYQGQAQIDNGRQTILEAEDHEGLSSEAHENASEFREEEQNYLGEFAKEIQNAIRSGQGIEQIIADINELNMKLVEAEGEYGEEVQNDNSEVSSTLSPFYTKEDITNIDEHANQLEQSVISQASVAKQQSSPSSYVSNIQNIVNELESLPASSAVSSSLSIANNELNSIKSLSSALPEGDLSKNVSFWKDSLKLKNA